MDNNRRFKKMPSFVSLKTNSYGAHCIDEEDIVAVSNVLRGPNLTCGDFIEQFEKELAHLVQSKYVVVCSNGTTALHLASLVAGVKPDDYVIVPTITFLATANAPKYCGANIIFCDVDSLTGLVTEDTVREAIQRAPKKPLAFYPVDLAGQPSCSFSIRRLCEEYGIKIIQDSAHSLGTTAVSENSKWAIGSNKYSDFTTFSFHPVKNITTGEGGAITTNDEVDYKKLKVLRSHGMLRDADLFLDHHLGFDSNHQKNPWYYEMQHMGYNYRMTDIQAALGLSQLKKIQKFKNTRRELKSAYDKALMPYDGIINPIKSIPNADPFWHLYSVLIDFKKVKKQRSDVMHRLAEKGIGTQVHYIPVHLQPYYKKLSPSPVLDGSMAYYSKTLSLPLHSHLNENDVKYVVESLTEVLGIK